MKIILNGEVKEIPNELTATQLVDMLQMSNDRIAMEVNQEIVPRSDYKNFVFSDGDKVEIVRAIGGG